MELKAETIYLINTGNFNVRKIEAYRLTKRGGERDEQRWLVASARESTVYSTAYITGQEIARESPDGVADWLNHKAEALRQHLRNIYTELELYATMKPPPAE